MNVSRIILAKMEELARNIAAVVVSTAGALFLSWLFLTTVPRRLGDSGRKG